MEKYDHLKIEKKWQEYWEKTGVFKTEDKSSKEKFYCLDMFPYPSGIGLHVGHPRGYTATDIVSNYKRMKGFNVLHPMGWDAFGLPAENYALKTGVNPKISTDKNIKRFKEQIKSIGLSYDWDREINTTDPEYFKWTQWIFIQLFKKGLAYESVMPINWCPSCKTGLANEEVISGKCERCGESVERKNIRQWVLKITNYADRLLEDLKELNWPSKIIEMQKNWIGRSEGADVEFSIAESNEKVKVYTTRPDTLFGSTFLVLAPEHELVSSLSDRIENLNEVKKYVEEAKGKSDLERTDLAKEKTGVELKGIKAVNPVNGEEVPVFVADYVLGFYGYGAIMSVPAHDERDYEFAKKFGLKIREVISGGDISKEAYTEEGLIINSGEFNGMNSNEAKVKITEWLKEKEFGEEAVNYKLRDWIFSRQRYWGEPIPLIHCDKCGIVPVKEEELPLKLPEIENYQPTGTGESPLTLVDDWVNTKCPTCGGSAKRETNTMPQWAGSCWYYLRYIDPKNEEALIDKDLEKHFIPVDLYVGGAEHAVLHLLYARFWHKFLYDIGVVSTKEPFQKLMNQGLIMSKDGTKMSKSKGNVVNPDDIIQEYGADTLRLYEMFVGPFADNVSWDPKGINGARRLVERIWDLKDKAVDNIEDKDLEKLVNQTIKKVTEDIEEFKFNTAISSLMILSNELKSRGEIKKEYLEEFLKISFPFAPHISEEVWSSMGNTESIVKESWPEYDKDLIKEEKIILIIQVNGKVRDEAEVSLDISEEDAKEMVLQRELVKKWMEGKEIKKVIFVPNKIINIVV